MKIQVIGTENNVDVGEMKGATSVGDVVILQTILLITDMDSTRDVAYATVAGVNINGIGLSNLFPKSYGQAVA